MVLVEVRNNLKQTLSHLNSKLLRCGSCKVQSIQLIWIIPNSIYFQAGSQQKAVYIKLINSENQYTAGMTLWHHKIDMRYSARQEWQDVTRGWAFFLWVLGWWQKGGRIYGVMADHLIRLGSLVWPLTATSWIKVVSTMMQSDILISAHRRIDFELSAHVRTNETG